MDAGGRYYRGENHQYSCTHQPPALCIQKTETFEKESVHPNSERIRSSGNFKSRARESNSRTCRGNIAPPVGCSKCRVRRRPTNTGQHHTNLLFSHKPLAPPQQPCELLLRHLVVPFHDVPYRGQKHRARATLTGRVGAFAGKSRLVTMMSFGTRRELHQKSSNVIGR